MRPRGTLASVMVPLSSTRICSLAPTAVSRGEQREAQRKKCVIAAHGSPPHHIPAGWGAHQTRAHVGVVLVERADVARVGVVVHHAFVVATGQARHRANGTTTATQHWSVF